MYTFGGIADLDIITNEIIKQNIDVFFLLLILNINFSTGNAIAL